MSDEKYIQQKARTLPIGECYITRDWEEARIANVLVTRVRPSGNLVLGRFLVDTYCLGVKDVSYDANITPERLQSVLDSCERKGQPLEEITYNEVLNLIYGAIVYAEEADIPPHKDFAITKYILEEDTEDIPLIEYTYGKKSA
ncbi:MAG: hypothetical protein NC402_07345 [Prevotella sp.]|nr:hypothetical protein [Prevotella sp.]MCM1075546.1 hypothetical protein [Ruminococcus sp.]